MSGQESTLIIADDQQIFAEGLKTILGYGARRSG